MFDMPDDPFDGLKLHAGIALRQRMHFGDQHQLGNFWRKGSPTPTLWLCRILCCSSLVSLSEIWCIGKNAKAGIDAVNSFVVVYDLLHVLLARVDGDNCFRRQLRLHLPVQHIDCLACGQMASTVMENAHGVKNKPLGHMVNKSQFIGLTV